MLNRHNILCIISAPSGTGKSSIINHILKSNPDNDINVSVSATTRSPRKGEVEGKDYYFVTKEQFNQYIKEDQFIEYCTVYNNLYGTLTSHVKSKLISSHILFDLDTKGAEKLRLIPEIHQHSISIFILPPSLKELEQRLTLRNSEAQQSLELRLKFAQSEISQAKHYDYIICNHDIEATAMQIINIIKSSALSTRNINNLEETLAKL